MKKLTLLIAAVAIGIFTMSYDILSNNGKAGATGSPGEGTCIQCHSTFPINSGGGSIAITAPTLTGWQYVPGNTYTINVTVAKTTEVKFGFGFEALQSSGANAGTLTITNATETQIKTKTVSGNIRNNVVHQLNGGATTDTHTFTFDWTAPATNVGDITFYSAGVASDGSGGPSNTYVYTTSQVVTVSPVGVNERSSSDFNMSVMPNPTTESCVLNYNLASNSKVAVELISLNGQLVRSYLNQEEKAGNQSHTLAFDQSIAKGVYFISLNINGTKHIQKIVVE